MISVWVVSKQPKCIMTVDMVLIQFQVKKGHRVSCIPSCQLPCAIWASSSHCEWMDIEIYHSSQCFYHPNRWRIWSKTLKLCATSPYQTRGFWMSDEAGRKMKKVVYNNWAMCHYLEVSIVTHRNAPIESYCFPELKRSWLWCQMAVGVRSQIMTVWYSA